MGVHEDLTGSFPAIRPYLDYINAPCHIAEIKRIHISMGYYRLQCPPGDIQQLDQLAVDRSADIQSAGQHGIGIEMDDQRVDRIIYFPDRRIFIGSVGCYEFETVIIGPVDEVIIRIPVMVDRIAVSHRL